MPDRDPTDHGAEAARPGREADLDAVEAVAARVVAAMDGARGASLFLAGEAARGPVRERFGRAVAGTSGGVGIVGTYDGVVLGFALATIEVLPTGERLGLIEALAVEPEARKVGIGAAMMGLIVDRLRAAGCVGVDARALPGDRETKNFFESFGLKARLLTVHQRFDDDGSASDDDRSIVTP